MAHMHALCAAPLRRPRAASRVCAPWPLRRPAAAAPRAPRATHLCARRGSRHTPRGAKSVPRPTRHRGQGRERRRSRDTLTHRRHVLTSRCRTSHAQVSSRPTRPGPGQRFFGVHGSAHADQASLQQQRLSCCLRDGRPAEWAEQLALQVARRCTRVDGRFHSVLASTATARAVPR